jgi:hypothetical protein
LVRIRASVRIDLNSVLPSLSLTPVHRVAKGPIDFASNVLRADLQVIRRLDIAQNTWANPLLSALEDSLTAEGTSRTLDVLVSELLQPSMMDFDRTNGDPLAYFAPVLCAIRICPTLPVPLARDVVNGYLPRIFDDTLHQSNSGAAHILAALLKGTLILTAELYPMKNIADVLAEHVVYELLYQKSRPGPTDGRPIKKSRSSKSSTGRPEQGSQGSQAAISDASQAALRVLCTALGGDEELKRRWSSFGRLV